MPRILTTLPLAAPAVTALAACALGLWSRPAGAALALLAALVLARCRAPSLLCVALGARLLLPDPAWPEPPTFRDELAAPLLRAIPEPDATIAVGSLLGGKSALPRDVYDAFIRSGTSHLLAVSGFNITLVAGALGVALRPLGSRVGAVGVLVTAVAFSLVAGFGASVTRAAVMASAGTVGVLLGRPTAGLNALAAAIVVLLVLSPGAVGDAGFLLSVSATTGLIAGAGPLERRLLGPSWLREQLGATLAASLASLPVIAALFGRVSLVSPLANLVVAPLVPPLMGASGIAMLLGHLWEPLGLPAAWAAFVLARCVRGSAELFASLPGAGLPAPPPLAIAAFSVAAVASGIAFLVLRRRPRLPRVSARRLGAVLVAAIALALTTVLAPRAFAPAPARVVGLDVGQGDAYLVEAGGARLLIDGGPEPARSLRVLGQALPLGARRFDVIALTHAHADHATGLLAVLDRYEVGLALEPAGMAAGDVADAWHAALARHAVPLRALRRGDRVRVGGLAVDVLAPFDDPSDPLANLVLRVRAGPLAALFLGDATERAQSDLLLHSDELGALLYVPPHHGARTPLASALVAAVAPRVALISVGANNRYGHPAAETLNALDGLRVLRTDRDGTLEVAADGSSIRCRTRASALPDPWSGWFSRAPPCV